MKDVSSIKKLHIAASKIKALMFEQIISGGRHRSFIQDYFTCQTTAKEVADRHLAPRLRRTQQHQRPFHVSMLGEKHSITCSAPLLNSHKAAIAAI